MIGTVFTLDEIKEKVALVAYNYEIEKVYLFGSYARGEANESSDLDFYITVKEALGLFKYMGFVQELEDKFGCHVDVLSGEIRDKDFYDNIINESIPIYEEQRVYPTIKSLTL